MTSQVCQMKHQWPKQLKICYPIQNLALLQVSIQSSAVTCRWFRIFSLSFSSLCSPVYFSSQILKLIYIPNICLKTENIEAIVAVGVLLPVLLLSLLSCCLICLILARRRRKRKDNEKEDTESTSGSRFVVELLHL